MNYMLLIYNDPAREPAYGTEEFGAMMAGYQAANRKMKADGVLRGGEGLQGIETARSLRLDATGAQIMDGPFAETREHLGGYYLIEVETMEAALTYAALIPSARFGTIEVRPLQSFNPAG